MISQIDLKEIVNKSKQYTELRVSDTHNIKISMLNGEITQNSSTKISGISSRSYYNGKWGFSSSPNISKETAFKLIQESTDNAKFISFKSPSKLLPSKPFSHTFNYDEYNVVDLNESQGAYINFLKEIDNYIATKYKDLLSRVLIFTQQVFKKEFATSDGSFSSILYPRSYIYIVLSIEKDGKPIELMDVYGDIGRFSHNFPSVNILFSFIDKLYENLKRKAEGIFAEAGIKKCILDSKISGMLAHEAIGHTVEADMVIAGSVAKDNLGKQVASPLITLTDFAHHAFSKLCPVPVFIDDEGTLCEDATIIKDGILVNYMNSKETAQILNMNLTGNARAYLFNDEPLVRMRNTAILPGNETLQQMISSIDDGYYLCQSSNGQADTNGEFMFSVTFGYEIKNGKLGKAIKDTTISGIAFELLKSVDMVSNDFHWESSGFCGKKQPIPVALGGAAIRCDIMIGGR